MMKRIKLDIFYIVTSIGGVNVEPNVFKLMTDWTDLGQIVESTRRSCTQSGRNLRFIFKFN